MGGKSRRGKRPGKPCQHGSGNGSPLDLQRFRLREAPSWRVSRQVAKLAFDVGATEIVLTPVYEPVFLGFSYGLRPGRGAQDALDALTVAIDRRKVNWIIGCDIRAILR